MKHKQVSPKKSLSCDYSNSMNRKVSIQRIMYRSKLGRISQHPKSFLPCKKRLCICMIISLKSLKVKNNAEKLTGDKHGGRLSFDIRD